MGAKSYEGLKPTDREAVVTELFNYQDKRCYICGKTISLTEPVDVDHIKATDLGGIDGKNNWGLTHASCNRSKSNRDLDLQRYLTGFQEARSLHANSGKSDETFNLGVALDRAKGASHETEGSIEKDENGIEYFQTNWKASGSQIATRIPVQTDPNNLKVKSFVGLIPAEYVFHDAEMNPRSIVDLDGFIEEFYRGNPQLLPSLAHLTLDQMGKGKVLVFDGQHKAAAQIFLGHRFLYLRVFINPDLKMLRKTNFGAHTKLAQIHFPAVIEDKVGYDIFNHAFESYVADSDRNAASESSFLRTLGKEERDEMKRHFKGYLKFRVLSTMGSESGQFFEYVEKVSARSKSKPLAYETVRKAFFENFLCLYDTDEKIDKTIQMRDLERDNLIRLLKLFADKALKGAFDMSKGIYKLEDRLATDTSIRDPHLRAYRICRSAPLIIVMRQFKEAMSQLLALKNRYENPSWSKPKPLWAKIEEEDWKSLGKMLDFILVHKVWIERNPNHIRNLQDTRQNSWEEILIRGRFPGATESVYDPIHSGALVRHASGA